MIAQKISSGESYSDFAILYRTNAQSRIFEEALNKLHIPCKIHGGLSFFQRKEIKDVLSYVRLCVNPKDEEAITRIINYPARGIGQTTVDKLSLLAQKNQISMWDVVLNIELANEIFNKGTISKIVEFRTMIKGFSDDLFEADAYSLTHRIVEQSGIFKDLKADTSIEGKNRYDNVQELLNGVKEFTEQESDDIHLTDYLEKIALLTDITDEDSDKLNKVTLMTVHSAKGLEFGNCFLVGLEENLFPSTMNLSGEKEIEEERRLFYVALTRAKKSAVLSYATSRRKWGNLSTCTPSRFISDIDSVFIEDSSPKPMFQRESSPFVSQFKSANNPNSAPIGFTRPQKPIAPPSLENFVPDLPINIKQGYTVLHATFGKGFVKEITGKFPDSAAIINFDSGEEKKLLLKFAKLQILSK